MMLIYPIIDVFSSAGVIQSEELISYIFEYERRKN